MCYILQPGPLLVRVRRVQLYPSILGNRCMHPSMFRPDTTFRHFCLIFPANSQNLHQSIEISNPDTIFGPIFPANGQILQGTAEDFKKIENLAYAIYGQSLRPLLHLFWPKNTCNLLCSQCENFSKIVYFRSPSNGSTCSKSCLGGQENRRYFPDNVSQFFSRI